MKIAFFVTEFPSISETFISNQIIELVKKKYQIYIFAQTRGNASKMHEGIEKWGLLSKTVFLDELPSKRFQKINCVFKNIFKKPVRNIKLVAEFFIKNKSKDGASIYQLLPFLRSPDFDILHAHFGPNGNYVSHLKSIGLFPRARFVTSFHGYDLSFSTGYYKKLFASAHAFTVNSNYTKNKLIDLGCSKSKIFHLPVSVDTTQFQNKKRDYSKKNEFILLFAGRLIALKGPVLFIQICRKIKQMIPFAFKGIIAGDGELFDDLKKMIMQSDVEDIVEMNGAVTQEEMLSLMDISDIFILPGQTVDDKAEAQGLVIQEAQAMQLPVIVSDAGGMKEGLIDGQTGFVVAENDIDAFVDKVILLLTNTQLKEKMGKAGRSFVKENFDTKILNNRLMEVYNLK